MDVGDHVELTGASMLVQAPHVEAVLDALADELDAVAEERPGVDPRSLVGEVAHVAIEALTDAIAGWSPPTLVTTDGEPLVLGEARYEVDDGAAARERLAGRDDIDEDDDALVWVDRRPNPKLAGGPTMLGTIRLDGGSLVLEASSKERLARGRAIIEETLGEAVRHRADRFTAVEDAIRARREAPAGTRRARAVPPEHAEIIDQHLRDHYRGWVDEPLPDLDGLTPREAAAAPGGEARVAALVDGAERLARAMPGGSVAFADELRATLGLPRRATEIAVGYDAERAPDPAAWLAADEDARARAIRDFHGDEPQLDHHVTLHLVVENQVAAGEPPETSATVARLVGAGATRHEAIHAVAAVLDRELGGIVRGERSYDRERVARDLSALRP